MAIPSRLFQGASATWTHDAPSDYASDDYTLVYEVFSQAGIFTISSTSRDGLTYTFALTTSGTADYVPGSYSWHLFATSATAKVYLQSGTVEVVANMQAAGLSRHDGRSHVRRTLDALEAMIEGKASRDQQEMSIAGRTIKRIPIPDLIKLRSLYLGYWQQEQDAERVAAGLASGSSIRVKFGI